MLFSRYLPLISQYAVTQDATDAGSQGARRGLDEHDSVYDAETEPSQENEAETLPAMLDTLGQQTQRPHTATQLHAGATTSQGLTAAARGNIDDARLYLAGPLLIQASVILCTKSCSGFSTVWAHPITSG
jgi:hypothetical protein